MRSALSIISALKRRRRHAGKVEIALEEVKIAQGVILSELNKAKTSRRLQDFEFKVFSQWGEDGSSQRLVGVVPIKNKTFIEFGIEDFSESNCRFLMMKDNWSGFVIDGSESNIAELKRSYYFPQYDLEAVSAFVTRENIDEYLRASGVSDDLGILSIDLDGNDFHILNAIHSVTPRILICEYNAIFGPSRKITVPYDKSFRRTQKHHSNLYYGASLAAIAELAARKGYLLVGTNSAGNNSFFVREDLMSEQLEALTVDEAFTLSKFREARDVDGKLTYLSGNKRSDLIRSLPVINVATNQEEEV